MPQAFDPNNVFVRVPASVLGPDGLGSISTVFEGVDVRTFDVPADEPNTNPEDYFPVGAVHVVADRCAIDCGGVPVRINTGIRHVAWWINRLAPNGEAALPTIHFQTRFAKGPTSEVIVARRWVPAGNDSFTTSGLIYEVSGPLGDQVELWARVPLGVDPVHLPVRINVGVMCDRLPCEGVALANGSRLKTGALIV